MRRALLLVGILLTALPPASASATNLVSPDGSPAPQQYRTWLAQAQVATPPGTVTLSLAPCPNGPAWAGGCADMQAHAIYLGPAARNKARFFHELGHIFDATVMSDAQRTKFEALAGRPGVWAAAASSDPAMEKFAEAYSMCARHSSAQAMQFGMYGWSPSPRIHRQACSIIRAAALAPASTAPAPALLGS